MATLSYNGELTAEVSKIQLVIKKGVALHTDNSLVSVNIGSLQAQDDSCPDT